jgi:hypothetical protein
LNLEHLEINVDKDRLFTINNSIFSANPKEKENHKENNVLYQQSMQTLKRLLDFASTLRIGHT